MKRNIQEIINLADDLRYLKEELEVHNKLYGSCPDSYVACVFYDGVKTKYRYAGNGEWEFLSGINSPYMCGGLCGHS